MRKREQRSESRGQQSAGQGRRIRFALFLLMLSALTAMGAQGPGSATAPPPRIKDDAIELYQALLDLQSPWTVMCVAAHPDDEDGATLTVLRRKYGAHTVTLFSTYGEGGQNAVGPQLYEELGVIRARETRAASEIQGSEAHFLGLRDFGFSKSAAEAFRFWGREEALRRMVLKIRELRPDIIITNHNTTSGHGHHQATGQLILEAFDAAADPQRFPEQLRGGLQVWQPQRLFVRMGAPGAAAAGRAPEGEAPREAGVISIDRSEADMVRGMTYAEQALRALQQHASQGPWPKTLPAGWATPIRYRLVRSAKGASPLPPDARTFMHDLRSARMLTDDLTPLAAQALDATGTSDILGALIRARKDGGFRTVGGAGDEARSHLMERRLNRALAAASRIKATLAPRSDVLIPGRNTRVTLGILNNGQAAARVEDLKLRGLRPIKGSLKFPQSLSPGKSISIELEHDTPPTAALNVPHALHLYDGRLLGEELIASVQLSVDGATFPVEAVTRMDIAPAIEIANISPSTLVLTPAIHGQGAGASPKTAPGADFTLHLINHQDEPFKGEIVVKAAGAQPAGRGQAVALGAKESREVRVQAPFDFTRLKAAKNSERPAPDTVSFSVVGSGSSRALTEHKIRVVWSEARVAPGLRVGYIRSFDDTLRNALATLRVEAKELTAAGVGTEDLTPYHAIIIDIRGYLAHPELVKTNARLMEYVRGGGTLIVFYHRTNEWNPDAEGKRPQLAPYPITLGNSRVTDETARVEFSEPDHPLLNYPNKITQEDFNGWIQERGLYYPQTWDSHYSAPLSTSDEGEQPLRGGLLAAQWGRGRYIYTSMVWYRQLREGVPGAYRVLANMISYGR
jgi:LmbE family N-acetylglucosaminyl deacetylase